MNFLKKIGAWFAALFTKHNVVAAATTVARVAETAGDVAAGNIPGAVAEAAQVTDAAKSIKVETKQ